MSNYMEQCDCYGYCDEAPCPACRAKPAETTTTRLRAVRVKRDAARVKRDASRAEAAELDIEWRRRFNDFLPYQGELDALEAEYLALAMELAEEVCR